MPRLLVFAGPNGSGKSTVTEKVDIVGQYVNADEIKKQLDCSDMEAAKIATETREYFLKNKMDFTFETVLSTPRNIELMTRAKEEGYYIVCIYILTTDPEINISRIRNRVKFGGHGVPDEKVRERFMNALRLFPKLFTVCDELYVFDNSIDTPEGSGDLIAEWIGSTITVFPNDVWDTSMLTSLIGGDYPDNYLKK